MARRSQQLPAGPTAPPALQSCWWAARPASFLERCRRRYGDAFTVRLVQGGEWVFLSSPDDARKVFTSDPSSLLAGATHELLEPLFGPRSVHLVDGAEHLRQRRLLLPPLHGEQLGRYAELATEIATRELRRWPTGEVASLPRLQEITLELIMRGIFGFTAADDGARVRAATAGLLSLTMGGARVFAGTIVSPRLFKLAARSRFLAFHRVMARLETALLDEIRARRRDPRAADRGDMLSLLVRARDEHGRGLDDTELKDNLVTLLIAGHETTATSLSWALHSLARSPAALADLAERIEDDTEAEAIVRETLRLHPPVPLAMRRLAEPLELGGRELPAGTNVAVCIVLLHRDPRAYDDPLAFRPERFRDDRPDGYSWAPFGGGTRRCLGSSLALLEMKLVLRAILSNRRLAATTSPAEAVSLLALRPARGGRVRLERRSRR